MSIPTDPWRNSGYKRRPDRSPWSSPPPTEIVVEASYPLTALRPVHAVVTQAATCRVDGGELVLAEPADAPQRPLQLCDLGPQLTRTAGVSLGWGV
jgi:hypothetical protein